MNDLQAIFWDFDGVILRSNAIRDHGFARVLGDFPPEQVDELLHFHRVNGGLSRYVKFRYFFETIREESVSEEEIGKWAERFSRIMLEQLADPDLLIKETMGFIGSHADEIPFYIVSGSDQQELRHLCKVLGIQGYFRRIHGSPTPKMLWVGRILEEENLAPQDCLLIGDAINDYDAARMHGMPFMAYGNPAIDHLTSRSIDLSNGA